MGLSNITNDQLHNDDSEVADDDDVEWDNSLETPYEDWISADAVTEEFVQLSLNAPEYGDGRD